MPEIARKSGTDTVHSPHGTGGNCAVATDYHTDVGSSDVLVEGIGVVRNGDAMESHPNVGCAAHAPTLSSYSGTVFANGKEIGRKGDAYDGHTITSGSSKVIAG